MPRTIGLDLSLTDSGLVSITPHATEVHRVKSKPNGSLYADASARIERIVGQLQTLIVIVEPELVIIESPALASKTGQAHTRAWHWGATYDMVRGLGVPVLTATPQAVKMYATGSGNADKDEVLAAVVRRYPDVAITNNNTADAYVLAAMGQRRLGGQIEDSLPKTHLRAMERLSA
ncbi:RuvC-like resolvase [Gordonia phage Yago84]|nr:RuvC-like resolvase [Gordonia phage Yago84]